MSKTYYLNISVLKKDNSIIIYDTIFSNNKCNLIKHLKDEVKNCIVNNVIIYSSMNWMDESNEIKKLEDEFIKVNTINEIYEKIKEYLILENGEHILEYKIEEFNKYNLI